MDAGRYEINVPSPPAPPPHSSSTRYIHIQDLNNYYQQCRSFQHQQSRCKPAVNHFHGPPLHSNHSPRRRFSFSDEQKHPPFFMIIISISQLATFAFYAFRSDEPISAIGPVPIKSRLIFNPYRRYEYWRFLTYMFVHAGYWHIVFNVLVQLAIGIPLELRHRFYPVFIVYLGGIVGGALGNSIADPYSYLAGSSSGCYALIAAHLSDLIINWRESGRFRWAKLLLLLVFGLSDLGTAVYERHFKPGRFDCRVSYGGHVAGATCGLLLGIMFLRNVKQHPWEESLTRLAVAAFVSLVTVAVMINILAKEYFPSPDYRQNSWIQNPFEID